MLSCFKSKNNNLELDRLLDEIVALRQDVKGLQPKSAHVEDTTASSSSGSNTSTNEANITTSTSSAINHKNTKVGSMSQKTKDAMSSNPDDCDVMISLNCKTMLTTAQRIREFLETRGVKVWLCVNMAAGADFRDEIISAVDACEVFLPLINEAWCLSKECKYEFNYGFRKSLTSEPQRPVILPMCFPDLQWNAHGHVRALLANTNALVYNDDKEEGEVLMKLLEALRDSGIETKVNQPSQWTSDDCQIYLEKMIQLSIEKYGKELDGKELLNMSVESLEELVLGGVRDAKRKVMELEQEAQEGDQKISQDDEDEIDEEEGETSPQEYYDGMYKVIAKTTNYYDGNVTESNVFLVTLQRNGIGSSGCAWNAGTIHNNYDGVTCVWQGEFSSTDGSFYFSSVYSNDTKEEYAGTFERCGGYTTLYARGLNSKYSWFGYGRKSYGMLDMMMCKLTADETRIAKEAMQKLALGDSDAVSLESLMQGLGPKNLNWDNYHQVTDSYPFQKHNNFCLTPRNNAKFCLGAPIAIQFELPDGFSREEDYVISIVPKGVESPDFNRSYFQVNEYTLQRGFVFSTQIIPTSAGEYEIALFNNDGKKIDSNPITITGGNNWK